jgi:hypothetical protein
MGLDSFFRNLFACVALIASSAVVAQDEVYTTNSNSNAVTVHARLANGNVAPLRVIAGPATGLSSPSGIAVDLVHDELIVANKTVPYSVTVYPRTASGNVAPLRTITGNLTGLDDPRGVSVDPVHDEFAVANRSGCRLTTFAGFNTGPVGIALETTFDRYLVTTPFFGANFEPAVLFFPRSGAGNISPVAVIGGSQATTRFATPNGLAVDNQALQIYVPNSLGDSIAVHQVLLTGVAPPLRLLTGPATQINNPQFVAIAMNLFADGFE